MAKDINPTIRDMCRYMAKRMEPRLRRTSSVLEQLDKTGLFKVVIKNSLEDINQLRAEMKDDLEVIRKWR